MAVRKGVHSCKLVCKEVATGSRNVTVPCRAKCALRKYYTVPYNIFTTYAGLAQLFRARPCQGRGQGLESPDPHHIKSLTKVRLFIWSGVRDSNAWPSRGRGEKRRWCFARESSGSSYA